jgi:hypothetical protein
VKEINMKIRAVFERIESEGDSRISSEVIQDFRRGQEAADMALSDDLRERVVQAVVGEGMSRNASAKRFGVGIASAVRWVARFKAKGRFLRLRWAGIAVLDGSKLIGIIFSVSIAANRI